MNLLLIDSHLLFSTIYRSMESGGNVDIKSFFDSCLSSIKKSMKVNQPTHALLCIDDLSRSWRRDIIKDYRKNRFQLPLSFLTKMPAFLKEAKKIGVASKVSASNESYDIISTMVTKIKSSPCNASIVIMSSDTRLYSLLVDDVELYNPFSRDPKFIRKNKNWLKDNLDLTSDLYLMYLCLTGCKSKLIPGVPGIGPVNALKLTNEYKDLTVLSNEMAAIDSAVGKSLRDNLISVVQKTFKLNKLKSNVHLGFKLSEIKV